MRPKHSGQGANTVILAQRPNDTRAADLRGRERTPTRVPTCNDTNHHRESIVQSKKEPRGTEAATPNRRHWPVMEAPVLDCPPHESAQQRRSKTAPRKSVHIVSLNSSGKPQLEAGMQYAHKDAAATLSQEHHSRDISWNDLRAHAEKAGWKIAGAPAVATAKGKTSAGVACEHTSKQD